MTGWLVCTLIIAVPAWILAHWIHRAPARIRKSRFGIEPRTSDTRPARLPKLTA